MIPEQFVEFADLFTDPLFLVRVDGVIGAANKAAHKAVGVPDGELSGKNITRIAYDPPDKILRFLAMCSGSKQPVVGGLTLRDDDRLEQRFRCDGTMLRRASTGSGVEVLLRCTPREETSSRFVLLNQKIDELNKEIRQHQLAEAALRENERVLDGVINNAAAVIYIKDLEGRFLLVNRYFLEVFGLEKEQILGKTDLELFPSDLAEKFRVNDKKVLEATASMRFEEIAPHKDGPHSYLSVKFPLLHADGEVYAICGISTDITSLKRAEGEIRRFNEELEQRIDARTRELAASNRELESYSYSIAHDLRAPLRSVISFSQILLEDYGDQLDAEGKDSLHRVVGAGKHMARLIDDILELSRISRGELREESVDLSKLLQRIIRRFKQEDTQKSVEWVIQPNIRATGDPDLLGIALENLVGNALKYTSGIESPRIEFGLGDQDGRPVYFMRDNGVGFDMRYADKLFGVFQRLHGSEFEGTGIGLATVQRIVHRHGGQVWGEGQVGQGATFYFTLAGSK